MCITLEKVDNYVNSIQSSDRKLTTQISELQRLSISSNTESRILTLYSFIV